MTHEGPGAAGRDTLAQPQPRQPPHLHLVRCQLAQSAQHLQHLPGRNWGCRGRTGLGTGQAESQEQARGQEQDGGGSVTDTAQGHGCTLHLPALLPWQSHPAQTHPSRISYFLSAFISRQSHSCRESLMPRSPSLLLPGSSDKGLLYLIGLPGSYTLMVPSPGLGWGGMSPGSSLGLPARIPG